MFKFISIVIISLAFLNNTKEKVILKNQAKSYFSDTTFFSTRKLIDFIDTSTIIDKIIQNEFSMKSNTKFQKFYDTSFTLKKDSEINYLNELRLSKGEGNFYCINKLKRKKRRVDLYIEVANLGASKFYLMILLKKRSKEIYSYGFYNGMNLELLVKINGNLFEIIGNRNVIQ